MLPLSARLGISLTIGSLLFLLWILHQHKKGNYASKKKEKGNKKNGF